MRDRSARLLMLVWLAACGPGSSSSDAGTSTDAAAAQDAGVQADAGSLDGGRDIDAGPEVDAGVDAGNTDAGDAGDAGSVDAGSDAGMEIDAGTDGGAAAMDGGVDAGPVQGECSDLGQLSDLVWTTAIDDDPPSPMGGTLTAGTYVLTQVITYTGPGGATGVEGNPEQVTVRLVAAESGFTVDIMNTRQDIGDSQQTLGVTAVGTSIVMTAICPENCVDCAGTASFTATDPTLLMFGTSDLGTTVRTFTRR